MPHRLKQRQAKIQEKRKTTPWREFVMEIASWTSLVFSKYGSGITRYSITKRVGNIIPIDEYATVRDGLTRYGKKYNEDISFFEQFFTLILSMPRPNILKMSSNNENSDFSDIILDSKNVYLSHTAIESQDILYSHVVRNHSSDVIGSLYAVERSQNIFESRGVAQSFNVFYSTHINDSSGIRWSYNLVGCHECILCSDLENQSYCIRNTKLEKETYFKEKQKILDQKQKFDEYHQEIQTIGIHEHFIHQCENITDSRYMYNTAHARNVIVGGGLGECSHIYDVYTCAGKASHAYGCSGTGFSEHIYCSCRITGNNVYYSIYLEGCSYCLGCIGLKNKSYCIFNKQYTKEDRYDKVDEIFTQMEQDGDLGKFFPGSMNPFYFNDTAAYLIDDSFTKEEVEAAGYMWRDDQIKVDIPEGVDVISTDDLDQYEGWRDQKRYIDPVILTKVIKDHQGNVYRIVKMEYDFLIKHALPLPRKHWLDRIKEHFKIEKRNETGDTRL